MKAEGNYDHYFFIVGYFPACLDKRLINPYFLFFALSGCIFIPKLLLKSEVILLNLTSISSRALEIQIELVHIGKVKSRLLENCHP